MPPVVNRPHVGLLTPRYASIHSENFKRCSRLSFENCPVARTPVSNKRLPILGLQ